jgi:hypothetical protein
VKRGQPTGGLADKAHWLYGARNAIHRSIKAFAYYPIAVFKGPTTSRTARSPSVSNDRRHARPLRRYPLDVKPNGDYLTVRYNGTEDNVVLWTFNNGVRKFVNRAPTLTPLELGTWHTLKISVHGTSLKSWLDDKPMHDYALSAPVSGKIGVWS